MAVNKTDPQCGLCKEQTKWSPEVLLIIIFAPELEKPYPLIAAEGYKCCIGPKCEAQLELVKKAVASHPATKGSVNSWTKALIVDIEGGGTFLKTRRPFIASA